MTAAHSDSSTFYMRNDALKGDKRCVRLTVKGYGGMNHAGWLDWPLTMAGQAVVRTPAGVGGRLIYLDRDLLTIPSLAIRQQRGVNRGHDYNAQENMQPLCALGDNPSLTALLTEELRVSAGDILAISLMLCPRQTSVRIGPGGKFFQTPRIGDLGCTYATLEGFLNTKDMERLGQLYCLFDNEEVGSDTRQGAMSSFLPDVLVHIGEALGLSAQARRRALAGSLLLSADSGHAVHPNFPEKTDPANKAYLNGGAVTKYSANRKHTATSLTAGLFQAICQKTEVPVQVFASRADKPGGSTLGSLPGHQVNIPIVDIDIAQLAMHFAVETTGSRGSEYMARACVAFFQAEFTRTADGVYRF